MVYAETFSRIDLAFYRERQVQGWSRKKKEALINGEAHMLPFLSDNYTEYGVPVDIATFNWLSLTNSDNEDDALAG